LFGEASGLEWTSLVRPVFFVSNRRALARRERVCKLKSDGPENESMVDKKPVKRAAKPSKPSRANPALKRSEAPSGIEAHIGAKLKAMYDEVLAQPIPDRLLDLLSRLDDKAGDR
jgi:hypothetical protein